MFGGLAKLDQKNFRRSFGFGRDSFFLHNHRHSVHPYSSAYRRNVSLAQYFRQGVVSSSRGQRQRLAFRTIFLIKKNFKNGPGVIIQSSHQFGVQIIIYAVVFQEFKSFFKVLFAGSAQRIYGLGGVSFYFRAFCFFAVQKPQGIFFESSLAILAEIRQVLSVINDELFPVLVAELLVSDGVDVDDYRAEAELFKRQGENLDDHHFSYRLAFAYYFQSELKKFPETPLLRIFVPEKRTFVPKHNRLRKSVEAVFYISSHHRRRSFGTQNKIAVAVAFYIIHLFLHDIRSGADGGGKKVNILQMRSLDGFEAVIRSDFFRLIKNVLVKNVLVGEQIVHSFGALDV